MSEHRRRVQGSGLRPDARIEDSCACDVRLRTRELAAVLVKQTAIEAKPGLPEGVALAAQASKRRSGVRGHASVQLCVGTGAAPDDLDPVDLRLGAVEPAQKRERCAELPPGRPVVPVERELERQSSAEEALA